MAPTTASKRSRPSFSPPRPGKSKVTKPTKERGTNGTGKSAARRSLSGQKQKEKARTAPKGKAKSKAKHRGAAGTMRAILDEASDEDGEEREDEDVRVNGVANGVDTDDDDDDEDDEEGHADEDEDQTDDSTEEEEEEASLPRDLDLDVSSPEPDFILAEVTITSRTKASKSSKPTNNTSDSDPPIPLPLIHRIMHAHFTHPERTSLSTDARALMGKYVEIFVKEAITRCVDEKRERAAHGNGNGAGEVGDTGWLEVEDLERVGTQLVLDF